MQLLKMQVSEQTLNSIRTTSFLADIQRELDEESFRPNRDKEKLIEKIKGELKK